MVNTTAGHPSLIKDQVANMLVKPLEAASVVLGSGAQIFNSSAPLRIPRLDSSGTVGFVGEGGQMSFLLEQAFKYLPSLLAANKQDFRATGAQARELPMVAGIIRNNPDLATEFINRAAQQYGRENAQQLAAGFGLQLTPIQQQEQQQDQGDDLEKEAV